MNVRTKFELAAALFDGGYHSYSFDCATRGVYTGYLVSVMREDGSGHSFILTIRNMKGVKQEFYFRTID